MRKILFLTLSLFIFAIGCGSPAYYHSQEKILELSNSVRFQDLPVPSGFKYTPLNSFVYESRKTRVCVLKYLGRAWPHSISEFYKENMSRYGWQILNIIEGEETVLSFRKSEEICIIKFGAKGWGGELTVSVSPISEGEYNPELSSE